MRAFWRFQSLCFSVSRLSCNCFPLAYASLILTIPLSLKYIDKGTIVIPFLWIAIIIFDSSRFLKSNCLGRFGSWLKDALEYSGILAFSKNNVFSLSEANDSAILIFPSLKDLTSEEKEKFETLGPISQQEIEENDWDLLMGGLKS